MGMGWGDCGQVKCSTQVEESKADRYVASTSIRAHDPWFELRFACDMAVRWYAMAMERVALECMQVEMGWGEWAGQVEHSSRGEQGWVALRVRPFVRVG